MKTASRGFLAFTGFVTGFLTLVFLFQFNRYLTPALTGDQLSLGMAAIYAVMAYAGTVVTILAFKPSVVVAKYMSGVGVAVTAGFVLSALYLFTVDLASGMMLLIITMGQAVVVGVVYVGAVSRRGSSDSEPENDTTPAMESSEPQKPREKLDSEPESVVPETESENSEKETESVAQPDITQNTEISSERDIDWWGWAQIIVGATIFVIGIPITVQSPVGVPILLIGLALIPRVRAWSIETLGRSDTDSGGTN
ncbi:hypothetical protein [Haloarcula laminariae]|uniref:hypothetical protein n=1 Tax=Haloarcula laminariae TaxID=2961577 RepID=UPI002405FA45|nr:hypothetical protein [Halomicroarcula sp. FL173]